MDVETRDTETSKMIKTADGESPVNSNRGYGIEDSLELGTKIIEHDKFIEHEGTGIVHQRVFSFSQGFGDFGKSFYLYSSILVWIQTDTFDKVKEGQYFYICLNCYLRVG